VHGVPVKQQLPVGAAAGLDGDDGCVFSDDDGLHGHAAAVRAWVGKVRGGGFFFFSFFFFFFFFFFFYFFFFFSV
jgi:hypothetical protein